MSHRRWKIRRGLAAALILSLGAATAGETKMTAGPATASPWSASLGTGWDSLYMFRGVNQLPGFKGYGSSISWSALSLSFSPTATDSLTLSSWSAFGLGESDYKEIDGTVVYTRTLGNFSLSAGYALYAVLSAPGGLYAHELSAACAYEIPLGNGTLTPALAYAGTLGPSPEHGGYVQAGSSYLELRADGDFPLVPGWVRAAPWIAGGFNFGYNLEETADGGEPFNGANHLEAGVAFPVQVRAGVSVSPYVALSHRWAALVGTAENVVWGGVAVTVEF